MKANLSDHQLYQTYSLDVNSHHDEKDRDAISCASFNTEQSSGLYYISPNSVSNSTHRRRTSSSKYLTSIDLKGNGVILNGSLFDAQLFQPSRSSYILDYNDTPQELNRFLEGHHTKSKTSHLDAHLFKLSFILTLSEWNVDKELLLDYCPHDDDKTRILEEMSYYKRFCFPEINSKEKNGGTLINDSATYIFTRTNSNGQVEYGYCRRITFDDQITKFPTVICIGKIIISKRKKKQSNFYFDFLVSSYSYFKLYDAILNELATGIHSI
jgi:hypothetical protein